MIVCWFKVLGLKFKVVYVNDKRLICFTSELVTWFEVVGDKFVDWYKCCWSAANHSPL